MGTIKINGKTFTGNTITINDGNITIDGIDQTPESKNIQITVEGNITTLDVDSCRVITVNGDVAAVKTMSADVDILGTVIGWVNTMSGDVNCGNVGGSVSTMSGNIKKN